MSEQGNRKPVLLAITGITATIFLVLAYRKYSEAVITTATSLHRSNAIRRPRRRWRRGHAPRELTQNPIESAVPNLRRRTEEGRPYGQYINRSILVPVEEVLAAGVFDLLPSNIPRIYATLIHAGMSDIEKDRLRFHIDALFVQNFLQEEFPAGWIIGEDAETLVHELGSHNLDEDCVRMMIDYFDHDKPLLPTNWDVTDHADSNVGNTVAQSDGAVEHTSSRQALVALGGLLPDDSSDDSDDEDDASDPGGSQNMLDLLYHIASEQAKREGFIHRNVRCNSCGVNPIQGIRFQCANCYDYDLCEDCEAQQVHNKSHIFYKIRIPAPPRSHIKQPAPVLYPGLPNAFPGSMPRDLQKQLVEETGMDKTEMEASYEQFKCLAGEQIHPESDPTRLGMAISRQNFDMYFTPTSADRPPAPNLIYDRIFAFYDFHNDGVITLDEYIIGIWALTNKSRGARLRRMFTGYDLDMDGYVDRRDFLRMFRAYYAISKELITETISLQDELNDDIRDVVHGSQPLSAAFGAPSFAGHASRAGLDKEMDDNGDLIISAGPTGVLQHDTEMRGDRTRAIGNRAVHDYVRDHRLRTSRRHPEADEPLLSPPSSFGGQDEFSSSGSDYIVNEHLIGSDSGLQVYGWPPRQLPEVSDVVTALGVNLPLDEVTDPIDRSRIIQAQKQRLEQLDKNLDTERATAVQEAWRRRQFYLDEEEGFTEPPGHVKPSSSEDEGPSSDGPSKSLSKASAESRRQSMRSRSSSKVRFDDSAIDTDHETRSNTSSRSIPLNERWGGFELSGAERDVGREIMYQAVQQGFNELLDPIFKKAEDQAMEAIGTKALRTKWAKELDKFEADRAEALKQADLLRTQALFSNSVDGVAADGVTDVRPAQVQPSAPGPEHDEADHIQIMFGNSPRKPQQTTAQVEPHSRQISTSSAGSSTDPTLPHNKPNDPIFTQPTSSVKAQVVDVNSSEFSPSDADLTKWLKHREVDTEAHKRGGYGKLSYIEFGHIVVTIAEKGHPPTRPWYTPPDVVAADNGAGGATGAGAGAEHGVDLDDDELEHAWSSTANLGKLGFLDTWLEMAQF